MPSIENFDNSRMTSFRIKSIFARNPFGQRRVFDLGKTRQQEQSSKERTFLCRIMMVCTLGSFLFGYDTGIINGALPFMREDLGLTPVSIGVVTSSLLVGAAFGAIAVGKLSDIFGRRLVIAALSVIFTVSTLGCAFAPSLHVMLPFRFLMGVAVGGASTIVPVFFAELAPLERRAQMVTWSELMIVTGQLISFIVNALMGGIWGDRSSIWRWMFLPAIIPSIGLLLGVLFLVPESPRWLISHGKFQEAMDILTKIRVNRSQAEMEFNEVRTLVDAEATREFQIRDLFKEHWLASCLLVGIGIGVCQQIAGVNSIMYYGTEILRDSGLKTNNALVGNIANGVVSVFSTIVSFWVLGHFRRRPHMMTGQFGALCTHLLIGIVSLSLPQGTMKALVVLLLTVTFLVFQQGAISPVSWIVMSEMFPLKIRGLGMGLCTFVLWMTNFCIGLLFPILVDRFGISVIFFMFGSVGVLALLFTWRCLPETKGKSLEELEEQLYMEDWGRLKLITSVEVNQALNGDAERRENQKASGPNLGTDYCKNNSVRFSNESTKRWK